MPGVRLGGVDSVLGNRSELDRASSNDVNNDSDFDSRAVGQNSRGYDDDRPEFPLRRGEDAGSCPNGDGDVVKSGMERRECPRLNLRLNVEFLSEGEDRQACRMGTTSDVSAGGVYFYTSEWQGMRSGSEVALRLSGLSGYGAGPLFRSLRARATVLRVDPPTDEKAHLEKAGVAAQFSEKPCFEVYRWSE